MSDWSEKQLVADHESEGRARQTLAELRDRGLGLDVLEQDSQGPVLVRRRSMESTVWRRVSGRGGAATVFELEGTP